MKKVFSLLFVCLFSTLAINAQGKLSPNQILDRTSEKIYSAKGIKATFVTTIHQGKSSEHQITGTYDVLGTKYVMQTTAGCTWFNGKDLWNMIKGNDEVTLVSPTPEEIIESSPLAFLGIYKKGYNLTSKNVTINGHKAWEVTMRAQDKKLEPSNVVVTINQKTFQPIALRIRHNGEWTKIDIKTFKTDATFPANHFDFPAREYPNCEIVDMR